MGSNRVDLAAGWKLAGEDFGVTATDGAILRGVRSKGEKSGPTIVFSHCWTGDRTTWDPVSARLAEEGYDVLVYEHRGHGESERGTASLAIEQLAEDMATVLTAQGVEKAIVFGHSLGGMTAQVLAINGDPRLVGLGLVATSARPGVLPGNLSASLGVKLTGFLRTRLARWGVQGFTGPIWVRGAMGRKASATAKECTLRTLRQTSNEVMVNQIAEVLKMDYADRLGEIDAAAIILVGSWDTLTPKPHAVRMLKGIRDAELRSLRGAGHMLPLERPEEVAQAVRDLHKRLTSLDVTAGGDDSVSIS